MKTRSYLVALALIAPILSGCSSDKKQEQQAKESAAKAEKDAKAKEGEKPKGNVLLSDSMDYATIQFDREETSLSPMDNKKLSQLITDSKGGGKMIEGLKVLTWSDRAVKTDQEATNNEIILARQRAESINKYLQSKVKPKQTPDFYNMAENPNRYDAYMKEKGANIMEAFKEEGNNPSSHAMVIIEYKSGPMPSSIK
jgi:PBP1b-binding outer membrane lipoprotein LpoB